MFPDFTAYEAARREEREEPVGFALYGEDFACEPMLSAGASLSFSVDYERNPSVAIIGFFRDLLLPEAWERFDALLKDHKARPVSTDTLQQILEAVYEQYAGRPTQPSGSSAPTPLRSGTSSKRGSSSKPAKARRSA